VVLRIFAIPGSELRSFSTKDRDGIPQRTTIKRDPLLEHKGTLAKAAGLRAWLSGLVVDYDDKILAVDAQAAALAGQLEAKAISAAYDTGMADATVAGIAKASNLVVVTRNTKHFYRSE